jgi:hypothetical protein
MTLWARSMPTQQHYGLRIIFIHDHSRIYGIEENTGDQNQKLCPSFMTEDTRYCDNIDEPRELEGGYLTYNRVKCFYLTKALVYKLIKSLIVALIVIKIIIL